MQDNTKASYITCTDNNTIYGISTDIKIGYASITFTRKSYISLDLQDCYVGDKLILTADNISMQGVLGISKHSEIILDKESTAFQITLRGNVNVHHGNTSLTMSGICSKITSMPQYSNISDYNIILTKLEQVLDSCKILHTKEHINVTFTHNLIDYSWYTTNANYTLHIFDKESQTYIKVSRDVDIMNLYTDKRLSYHHNHEVILERSLILKKVYYNDSSVNYDTLNEFRGVIENFHNLTTMHSPIMPIMRITNRFQHDIVLLFEDDKANEYYHIFPYAHNAVSINNINYQITKDRICAVLEKTDYIGQQLEYFSLVDDKEKKIGICVNTKLSISDMCIDNTTVVINGVRMQDLVPDMYVYFSDTKLSFGDLIRHCIAYLDSNIDKSFKDIEHHKHRHHFVRRDIEDDWQIIQNSDDMLTMPEGNTSVMSTEGI